jgi:protein-disulfide isomerase
LIAVTLSCPASIARRRFLDIATSALLALSFGLAMAPARAQTMIPLDQLMAAGPLPDMAQGSASAPVVVIEYASMTCSHCAAFHAETWPAFKARYVDTGKVKFILREFPADPLATAAFMLARCVGPDKRNALIDLLYVQQSNWAFGEKPIEALAVLVKQAGVTQAEFAACLKNQQLYDAINQTHDLASERFKVSATPTFFVNGRRMNGELPIEAFDKALAPLLK